MNYAELIAEADRALLYTSGGEVSDLPERLAAALRELAPPEGWRVTEYGNRGGDTVNASEMRDNDWVLHFADGTLHRGKDGCVSAFPTASAAMAALDGEIK